MSSYHYDLIVIGGGSAGLTAAKTAQGFGKKVVIIEKNKLGGECTWNGCVPSKALIKIAHDVHAAKKFTKVALDTTHIMENIQATIQKVYTTHTPEVLNKAGIETIFGSPSFKDSRTIEVNNKSLSAKYFAICTGSRPSVPPIKGLDSVKYLMNETLFALKQLPKSMIILGGGAIGCEMASALNRLGVSITVIEISDRLVSKEDDDMSRLLGQTLQSEGVTVLKKIKATSVIEEQGIVSVICQDHNGKEKIIKADSLLVATGRKPNIEELNLDNAGIKTHKKGIKVDSYLRTSTRTIYACGDVVGPYLFSHVAWYQAITVVRNCFIPFFKKKISYDNSLWITFTAPELATAGLTEKDARDKYGDIKVYKHRYQDTDRGRIDNADGLCKIICTKRGKIIGAHIFGPRAGELIHEVQVGKVMNVSFFRFASIMHAYPSYSEVIWNTARKAYLDRLMNNPFVRLIKYFKRS